MKDLPLNSASPETPLDARNMIFFILTPLAALIVTPIYLYYFGFSWADFFLFFVLYYLAGLSITSGYHRSLSHRAYKCGPIMKAFYLFFGASAVQESAINWSTDHRRHHLYVDEDKDPYSINRGFFWAHVGWILHRHRRDYKNVPDLMKDKMVYFQHKYYVPIAILSTAILPLAIGAMYGRPLGGLIWGGLIKMVFLHHMTFLINSAAHVFGNRPYSKASSARDNWWLPFLTFGEGYHNFHHTFASDYRNGVRWYQFDPSKWLIWVTSKLGLASNLKRTPDDMIQKARYQRKFEEAAALIEKAPAEAAPTIKVNMEDLKAKLDEAVVRFNEMKRRYIEWKKSEAFAVSKEKREELVQKWREELASYRKAWAQAKIEYFAYIRQVRRELAQAPATA